MICASRSELSITGREPGEVFLRVYEISDYDTINQAEVLAGTYVNNNWWLMSGVNWMIMIQDANNYSYGDDSRLPCQVCVSPPGEGKKKIPGGGWPDFVGGPCLDPLNVITGDIIAPYYFRATISGASGRYKDKVCGATDHPSGCDYAMVLKDTFDPGVVGDVNGTFLLVPHGDARAPGGHLSPFECGSPLSSACLAWTTTAEEGLFIGRISAWLNVDVIANGDGTLSIVLTMTYGLMGYPDAGDVFYGYASFKKQTTIHQNNYTRNAVQSFLWGGASFNGPCATHSWATSSDHVLPSSFSITPAA